LNVSQVLAKSTGMKAQPPMSEAEAKEQVARLFEITMAECDARITQSRFMTELKAGTLPQGAIQKFWLNWTSFVFEINNFIQVAYQRHLGFFKEHLDLFTVFADKVADELIHPKAPGHLLTVWKQGEIFGLTMDEMINNEMLPECRAQLEWHRGLLYEGTLLEFWAAITYEEYIGHWSKMFREGLEGMGYASERAPYFHTHEEADLEEHDGVMGHGEFNRAVIARLYQTGNTQTRPGFSAEYAALTGPYYMGMFVDACYQQATGS
jgi:pyrroloquinoline quinone (PQQ) biosynthesis protein C